jgi:NAD-dependent SIR2 family protein deacetylase
MAFATAKYAYGLCDQCGQRYKLKRLKKQWDGIKSCPQCYDTKHPQLQPKNRPADPEALRDPRPNTDIEVFSGKVISDDVIGSNLNGFKVSGSLGNITVIIS